MPPAGRRRAGRGVRGGGEGRAGAAADATRSCWRQWSRCKVGPDIHAKVGQSLYSVPWKHIGQTLDARSTATMVQLFSGGDLVKTHVRKPRGKQTDLADYPPEKIAFHMRTPPGAAGGPRRSARPAAALIAGLLADNALYRLRAAQGVLGLADKHQPGRLEAACAKAAAAGDPSYRTVKGILAAGTEAAPVTAPAGDGGAAAFLHGPDALFAAEPAAGGNVVPLHPGHPRRRGSVVTSLTATRRRRGAHAHHGSPPHPAVDHHTTRTDTS